VLRQFSKQLGKHDFTAFTHNGKRYAMPMIFKQVVLQKYLVLLYSSVVRVLLYNWRQWFWNSGWHFYSTWLSLCT